LAGPDVGQGRIGVCLDHRVGRRRFIELDRQRFRRMILQDDGE
jgi:hypothetical protein